MKTKGLSQLISIWNVTGGTYIYYFGLMHGKKMKTKRKHIKIDYTWVSNIACKNQIKHWIYLTLFFLFFAVLFEYIVLWLIQYNKK